MFFPIRNYTHHSILSSVQRPEKLVEICSKYEYKSCGLTDIDSVSASVAFTNACKKAGIKPVLGTEIIVENKGKLCLIAKNLLGWREILNLISVSNSEDRWNILPNLLIGDVLNTKNLIVIDGFDGSLSSVDDSYSPMINGNISDYYFTFDDETEDSIIPLAKKLNRKTVATFLSLYSDEIDYEDYKLISCIKNKCFLKSPKFINQVECNRYYSNEFTLVNPNLPWERFAKSQRDVCQEIDDLCDNYDINEKPKLPTFKCPNDIAELEYLTQLARNGYARKKLSSWDAKVYGDRAKKELAVIAKAGLSGYFLIVRDYILYAKSVGMLPGPARGSSAGSLISYLLDITNIDPIPYNLLFERFYNEGRNSPGKISYPDIDSDFPPYGREKIISYLRDKYGQDNIAQIMTLSTLQGRSAIREVLRVHEACDTNTLNTLSKVLPQEGQISDKLEEADEKSIINWTLDNDPEILETWCKKDEDGNLTGDLSQYFDQAIRIEGIIKSFGKHASGVVVSNENLNHSCPMIKEKNSAHKIIGFEKDSLEPLGHIKFDILGVSVLSKLTEVNQILSGAENE